MFIKTNLLKSLFQYLNLIWCVLILCVYEHICLVVWQHVSNWMRKSEINVRILPQSILHCPLLSYSSLTFLSPMGPVYVVQLFLWLDQPWNIFDLPGIKSLPKTDTCSLTNHQIPIVPSFPYSFFFHILFVCFVLYVFYDLVCMTPICHNHYKFMWSFALLCSEGSVSLMYLVICLLPIFFMRQ